MEILDVLLKANPKWKLHLAWKPKTEDTLIICNVPLIYENFRFVWQVYYMAR